MKETVNVSIASQAFTLDNDAYQLLSGYLREVKSRLSGAEKDETYTDIEARIAEIFREKLPSPMLVVTIGIVREAMGQMGTPDDFGSSGASSATDERNEQREKYNNHSNFTALRRSTSDKMIAGVCGGLAEHFGVDSALLRLITIMLVLFGGLSLWVYIIFWIIIPVQEGSNFKK
ncbi:MAG: PspC domain-containing protein [Alistipes sp.]|nr:PspC domain-containing protein [Alistipes sp.]